MDKETIKQLLTDGVISNEVAAKYCPELREESEDERIRKEIISLIKGIYQGSTTDSAKSERDKYVAWLEKQGEQNPAFEMNLQEEPKFNIGNKIQEIGLPSTATLISDIRDGHYFVDRGFSFPIQSQDKWELVEDHKKKDFRERYRRIAESTEFMSSHDGMSIGEVIPFEGEDSVSEDLEEAADRFAGINYDCETESSSFYHMIQKEAFKSGAQWKKQQMMKNAVECDVLFDGLDLYTTETWGDMDELLHKINAKEGDKVKLIIIKEE